MQTIKAVQRILGPLVTGWGDHYSISAKAASLSLNREPLLFLNRGRWAVAAKKLPRAAVHVINEL